MLVSVALPVHSPKGGHDQHVNWLAARGIISALLPDGRSEKALKVPSMQLLHLLAPLMPLVLVLAGQTLQ